MCKVCVNPYCARCHEVNDSKGLKTCSKCREYYRSRQKAYRDRTKLRKETEKPFIILRDIKTNDVVPLMSTVPSQINVSPPGSPPVFPPTNVSPTYVSPPLSPTINVPPTNVSPVPPVPSVPTVSYAGALSTAIANFLCVFYTTSVSIRQFGGGGSTSNEFSIRVERGTLRVKVEYIGDED